MPQNYTPEFKKCLLINTKTLDFTDFYLEIWYNTCKVFDKMTSFSLQIFDEFHE